MGSFSFEIELKQKRWVELGACGEDTYYNVRNRITKLSIVDPGEAESSVGVQSEMFLNIFPPGRTLTFVNGIMQDFQEAAIVPYRMAYAPIEGIIIADNYLRLDVPQEQRFQDTVKVKLSAIDDVSYNYTITIPYDGVTTYTGEATYGEHVAMVGSGLSIYVLNSTALALAEIYNITDNSKMQFRGSWIPASMADDGDVPGVHISAYADYLTFTYKGDLYSYDISWDEFKTGVWVDLPDPEQYDVDKKLSEQILSGVEVKFGFDDVDYTDLADNMDIPDSSVTFDGAFLNVEAAQEEFEESCVYRRVMDIVDLQGSLGRYDELSSFYRAFRLKQNSIGQYVMYQLVEPEEPAEGEEEDDAEWELYTGSISTTQTSLFRSATCRGAYLTLEAADNFAVALVNMLKILKSQYTDYINITFSTDTDEYPTSEEQFDI